MNRQPTEVELLQIYRKVYLVRETEETIVRLYPEQEMRCPVHLSIGQEAAAAGMCQALRNEDLIFTNHRCHGHYLAKGGSLKKMFGELYLKDTGCIRGLGGSMHLMDLDVGVHATVPIVGGIIPVAVGAAFTAQYSGLDQVSTVFIGDACVEEGVFHESLNFALLKKLPVIFFCENNQYSVYTHLNSRQPKRPILELAAGHGVKCFSADGNDAIAVYNVALEAVEYAKSGNGPAFIEVPTYRWREHCGPNFDNNIGYRTEEEYLEWKKKDPLELLRIKLAALIPGWENKRIDIESSVNNEIKQAVEFAKASPAPDPSVATKYIYAE